MQILKANTEDILQIKQLWMQLSDDGIPDFCNFIFSYCKAENIYIAKKDEKIVSMLMAVADMEYKGHKGFQLCSAFTLPQYESMEYMRALTEFALEDQKKQGKTFCVMKPSDDSMFDLLASLGFANVTKVRRCELEIKKNIWAAAQFDIVTASRFKTLRDKFCDENFVHYTSKGYETFAGCHYMSGGSTAENEEAYAVYYLENGRLLVTELLATSTLQAVKLLQAIRERTGCETAVVYLSPQSNLFLGEGSTINWCAVNGISDDVYVNLMIE